MRTGKYDMTKAVNIIKYAAAALLTAAFTAYLLFFGAESRLDASNGLNICANVILTTVFPFSVASQLLITSGVCGRLGKIIKAPASFLFGLSPAGAGILLLGLIGGYPCGAYGASELYKNGEIGKSEAEALISYTNNATPAFMINYIGPLLGSARLGALCYFLNVAAALLWAFFLRGKTGKRCDLTAEKSGFSFVSAVTKSASSAVYTCAFVIIFSVISGAFARLDAPFLSRFMPALFEITTGASILAASSGRLTAAAVCGAVSFSGLCVAAQVFSVSKEAGISAKYYVFAKIFQGFICFISLYLIYPFIIS